MSDPSPLPARSPGRRPPALAALLGWILPGLGQLYVGQGLKATLFFVAIVPTFLLGWVLTDFTGVDPSAYTLDFVGQAFLGGPTLGAVALASGHVLDAMPPFIEVGRLYLLVAGLLNLVAVCDAVGEAIARDRAVMSLRLEQASAATRAGRETALADDVPASAPEAPATPTFGWDEPS